jgi:hypothetical protein
VKPRNYIDDIDNNNNNDNKEEEGLKLPDGVTIVNVKDLPIVIEKIIKEEKKTPFLIDNSNEQITRTFYSYKGKLEDVSQLTIPFAKSGVRVKDVVERLRKGLVSAIKTGTIFVLYLGDCTYEHADFKKKLCKKDTFPSEVFMQGGAKLLNGDPPKFNAIFREEDMEHGQCICRDGFSFLVISSLSPMEYTKKLEDSIPLGYMKPLYVVNDS